jgi:hypothetical protein
MSGFSALKRTLICLGLAAAQLVAISPVHALGFREERAGWVNTYAGHAAAASLRENSAPPATFKNDTTLSVINVSYTDVPPAEENAVQAAINIWTHYWQSTVPVKVNARFVAEGTGGILASASPVNFFQGFTGAPDPNIWYPSAMANALAGKDLDPNNPQIQININSTMASSFYLGTDGNCPMNEFDLESIIIHEMTHGFGFLSNDSFDPILGYGTIDQPTPYDAFAQTPDGSRLMDLPSPSLQLGSALENTLVWSGPKGIAANNGVKPLLYTPNPYEDGSSVSHLDEDTFKNSGPNALMTPSWPPGAVFTYPGALAVAMLQDMRSKPPAGKPAGIPDSPRNVAALVGDKSAIVTFSPPDNARTSIVSSYTVKVDQTDQIVSSTSSPVTIAHLVNGNKYSFTITASNDLGNSSPVSTNVITPQASWQSTTIDPTADAHNLATATFQGKSVIAYDDSKTGYLKLATWNGKSWKINIIDGNSTVGGRTKDNLSGGLSVCTSAPGAKQRLDIFYGDLTNKWLRYAGFDGKKWIYNTVDGNGPTINAYTDPNRVRTASDVSGPNACVDTPDGLQVFYRDQSQGIILGAVALPNTLNTSNPWNYELVDGDRDTDGRTTGDVGFHIAALNVSHQIYLLYDSVLQVDRLKNAIDGEVRLATRASAYPEDWKYQSLDSAGTDIAVAGYAVALNQSSSGVKASWLAADSTSLPNPSVLRYADLTHAGSVMAQATTNYGAPQAPLASDGKNILFNCQNRLCAFNTTTGSTVLVSGLNFANSNSAKWIYLNKTEYAVVGAGNTLKLFKAH